MVGPRLQRRRVEEDARVRAPASSLERERDQVAEAALRQEVLVELPGLPVEIAGEKPAGVVLEQRIDPNRFPPAQVLLDRLVGQPEVARRPPARIRSCRCGRSPSGVNRRLRDHGRASGSGSASRPAWNLHRPARATRRREGDHPRRGSLAFPAPAAPSASIPSTRHSPGNSSLDRSQSPHLSAAVVSRPRSTSWSRRSGTRPGRTAVSTSR